MDVDVDVDGYDATGWMGTNGCRVSVEMCCMHGVFVSRICVQTARGT